MLCRDGAPALQLHHWDAHEHRTSAMRRCVLMATVCCCDASTSGSSRPSPKQRLFEIEDETSSLSMAMALSAPESNLSKDEERC